jgi:hypothetical protein
MSQNVPGVIISCDAGGSITANRVVYVSAKNAITLYPNTYTSAILGVALDSGAAGTSIPVCISGTAKVAIGDSLAAGAVVIPDKGAVGRVIGTSIATATVETPVLGIALEGASTTGALIEVALLIKNNIKLV